MSEALDELMAQQERVLAERASTSTTTSTGSNPSPLLNPRPIAGGVGALGAGDAGGPDLTKLRRELVKMQNSSDLNDENAARVGEWLDELDAGGNPFESWDKTREVGDEDHGFLRDVGGKVLGGAFDFLLTGSSLASTAARYGPSLSNPMGQLTQGAPAASLLKDMGLVEDEGREDRANQSTDWLGLKGALAGVHVPFTGGEGVGPVGGDSLWMAQVVPDNHAYDLKLPVSFNELMKVVTSQGGALGSVAAGADQIDVPFGWADKDINLPDPESLTRWFAEFGLDPLNFVGKGGVVAQNFVEVLDDAGEVIGMQLAAKGPRTLAGARAGRVEAAKRALANHNALMERGLGFEPTVLNGALDAIREGGTTRAVKLARNPASSFNISHLHALGVDTQLMFGRALIPGTEGAMSVLGALRFGQRTARAATAKGRIGQALNPARLPENLSRMAARLGAAATDAWVDDAVTKGYSTLEVLQFDSVLKDAVKLVPDLAAEGTTWIEQAIKQSGLSIVDDDLLGLAEGLLDQVKKPSGSGVAGRARSFLDGPNTRAGMELAEETVSPDFKAFQDVSNAWFYDNASGSLSRDVAGAGGGVPRKGPSVADIADPSKPYLRKFMNDETVPLEFRVLFPAYLSGLVKLDAIAVGTPSRAGLLRGVGGVDSLTPAELAGLTVDGKRVVEGALTRNNGTLRQFYNSVASIQVIDSYREYGYSLTASNDLVSGVYNMTSDTIAAMRGFGMAQENVLFPINPSTIGSRSTSWDLATAQEAAENLKAVMSSSGIAVPLEFQQAIARPYSRAAMEAISNGDWEDTALRMNRVTEVGRANIDAVEMSIKQITDGVPLRWDKGLKGKNRKIAQGLSGTVRDRGRNAQRASALFKKDPDQFEAEVRRIIRNQWYNPDIQHNVKRRIPSFSQEDRAFLAQAYLEAPDMITGELDHLRGWMNEWTEIASTQFARYDVELTPAVADAAKAQAALFQEAVLTQRMWGGDALDTLSAKSSAPMVEQMSWAEADEFVDDLLSAQFRATGQIQDSFGFRFMDEKGEMARGWKLPGINTELFEAADFLMKMKRAQAGHLQPVVDTIAAFNRLFKSGATAKPGFDVRNAKGGLILNHVRGGVRVEGIGGYREFAEVFDLGLAARADEAARRLAPGGSELWASRRPLWMDDDALDIAQRIAYSGEMTSASSSGNILDIVFELSEVPLSATGAKVERVTSAMSARSEQAVFPLTRAATTRRMPEWDVDAFTNEAMGLSTRQTTEGWLRGAQLWSSMRKDGLDWATASHRVSRTHFDYSDLTNTGQLLDELMPFFLFRARMSQVTLEMMISTPGMAGQIARARRDEEAMDPYGISATDQPYTFGMGSAGNGLNLFGRVDDPRDEFIQGPLNMLALANSGFTQEAQIDLFREEVLENMSPLLKGGVEAAMGSTVGFGSVRTDTKPSLVQSESGLMPRLAEAAGWSDRKIELVEEFLGLPQYSPIADLLKITTNVSEVNGQLYITENGENWLMDMMPLLNDVERLSAMVLLGDPEYSDLSEEEIRLKATRQSLNAVFGIGGVPTTLTSPDMAGATIAAYEREVADWRNVVKNQPAPPRGEGAPSAQLMVDAFDRLDAELRAAELLGAGGGG